ncbi:LuxR C-terminal-related transcriptional regulator [Serratia fonticola]|uniref:LuxR C-terminal-related transcriptional regulator n=1 Tax=Serratia fonticola TaxID=47917 RepID=A0AAJ1YD15_SERFO|nr:LuxR C-terminal-related transcriptional regulator [Serratia fonticola]MDQ9127082.1 LuxR C-terminal-related transcriptional regulator [Serratia fonticola]
MNITHATILHPCQFTRSGLIGLLPANCEVLSTEKILQCHLHLLSENIPNLIILSLQGVDYSVIDVLSLIDIIYKENHQHRILIVIDIYRNSGLIDYLQETSSRIGFIDTQNSLSFITKQINELIVDNNPGLYSYNKKNVKVLSLRERQVLSGILMEFNYKQIAQMLSISSKLVGYYKRIALRKLGVKSMQSLLIPTNQLFRVTPVLTRN